MILFIDGEFTAHSGETLPFKIDCDALSDQDIKTLAREIGRRLDFTLVHGIPRGGLRLAKALELHCRTIGRKTSGRLLIVDDVLTTGRSMEEARQLFGSDAIGAVIFARGPCPDWIMPLFVMPPAPRGPASGRP